MLLQQIFLLPAKSAVVWGFLLFVTTDSIFKELNKNK